MLVTVACGGSAKSVEEPEIEEVDSGEAEGEARDVIGEVHAALKRGTPEGLLPVLAEDLFVALPDGKLFTERSAAVVAMNDLFGGKKHKLKSRGLVVAAGPGGHAAWATEEVELDGTTYAVTVVLEDVDEIWVVSAVHVARPVADKAVKAAVESGKLAAPPELPAVVEPAAKPAVDLFLAATQAEEPRAEQMAQLADRKSVVLLGSAPKSQTKGVKKIKKLWNKALKQSPTIEPIGDPHAAATADGALVWILVNLDLADKKSKKPVPHRAFYVYERAEDAEGGWLLVAAHEAVLGF
jgi:ketosteroid isomerase-like protein